MRSTRRGVIVRFFGAATALTLAVTGLVAISSSTATAAGAGTGTGYLSTKGNQIVDASGATVRLTGINWFGMETDNHTFHGLWANVTWKSMMDHMAQLGYNTIRVPFTGDSLKSGAQATSVNTNTNPDLVGLSPLDILDKVVGYAGQLGMRIILDRHRPSTAGQTPLWYTASVSEASMIADWQLLAKRYAGNPTVVGGDLFNEPHAEGTAPNGTGACWGCGDTARDWRLAAQRIGNAVLSANPNWLIVVEGVSCPSGAIPNSWDSIPDDPLECGWWGGNLSQVGSYPVQLSANNKLVYSAHDYGISVYDHQDWFDLVKHPEFPANLPAVWDHFWGYIYKQNIAPVLIGEFGSTLADARDVQWLNKLVSYMGTGSSGMSFTYWSWNPDSGDTGGIVKDDWVTVQTAKQSILQPALVPPVPSGVTPTPTGAKSCTATFSVANSWQGGFQAGVTVKAGSAAIASWSTSFTMSATVSNLWSGTLSSSGSAFTVKNAAWNGAVAAGQSTSFGFVASGTAPTGTVAVTCTAG